MPRTAHFGTLLSLLLIAGPLTAQSNSHVEHVLVRDGTDGLEVEIQTSGAPVSPETQAVTLPDRIVVDFPGALPSAELRALRVNRGALKGIRSGLFASHPPTTRIVLDLTEAQSYRISTTQNSVIVKLGTKSAQNPAVSAPVASARLREATNTSGPGIAPARLSTASISIPTVTTAISREPVPATPPSHASDPALVPPTPPPPPEPPKPSVTVSYENGMLSIHAEKATLSQVLFEVQLKTQAEIAIPAGAEQEPVVANLGPAPARDVLSALLNGSHYNFIFVGSEHTLERVILTRRDPNAF